MSDSFLVMVINPLGLMSNIKIGQLSLKSCAFCSYLLYFIKEYREALIAETVTGKIDVRGWQKKFHLIRE